MSAYIKSNIKTNTTTNTNATNNYVEAKDHQHHMVYAGVSQTHCGRQTQDRS